MSGQKSTQKTNLSSTKTIDATKKPNKVDNTRKSKQRIIQNFLLIWLDSNIDQSKDECQKILLKLRSIVNTVYIFTNPEECIQFFNEINNEKIYMIASGTLAKSVVSRIHSIIQLDTIYIFCSNKTQHEQWTKNWFKIKGVYTQITVIFELLQKAVKQCNQDSIPLSFVSNTNSLNQNLDHLEPSFMYTQIFKEILFELEYNKKSVQELANYCRQQFAGNTNELNIIDEFEQDYHPETSIWWYTRECFTYQMLNRALRTLESDIIMKMGFFIRDLHQQIEQLHGEQFGRNNGKVFTVYRGQTLSINEFEKLEKTKGGLLSFNNFLSTSKNKKISLAFAHGALTRADCVGILFQMTINPSNSSTSFALIDNLSYIKTEEEVLFSMHTIFRIGEIEEMKTNHRIYQVNLTLTSDNDRQLQILTEQIRDEISPKSKGWYRMGELLLRLGQIDKAEQLYSAVLKETSNPKEQADIYYQLGRIKYREGDYIEAIEFYEKELEIDRQHFSSNPIVLASTYNNIGAVYDSMKDYSNASFYYEKAIEIYQKHLPPNHSDLAASYNNIGLLYDNTEDYAKALEYYQKSLEIKEKTLPSNHPLLATSYNNIATVLFNLKDYSKALLFYEKALDIEEKTLPSNHPDLATTYNNIAIIYEEMNNYPQALLFYQRTFTIKQHQFPSNPSSLKKLEESLAYIQKKC